MMVGARISSGVHCCLKCAVYLSKCSKKLDGFELRTRVDIGSLRACLMGQERT